MHLAEIQILVPRDRLDDVGKYLKAQTRCPVTHEARPAPAPLVSHYIVSVAPVDLDPERVLEFRPVAMYLLGML